MAFFKFRKGGDEQPAPAPQPESVEAMRKRARYRLVGAAVLVAAGVIGFPLLFDSQPRPISVDIPIVIPDKNKTRPLAMPVVPPAAVTAASEPVAASAPAPAASALAAIPAKDATVAPKPEEKAAAAVENKAPEATNSIAKKEPKTSGKPGDGAKAQALLDGKPEEKATSPTEGRFVVQVGAFADATRARDARSKLERAGLKTYTQVVDTKDGQRTRVRVGPFTDRADADEAAHKIKAIALPAAVLTL